YQGAREQVRWRDTRGGSHRGLPDEGHRTLQYAQYACPWPWWAFDLKAGTITVRAGVIRPGEWLHREFSEADIQQVTEQFADLEVELYQLQADIRSRSPHGS